MQNAVMSSLQNIYYFPSASVMITQQVGSSFVYFTQAVDPALAALIQRYYPIGTSRINFKGDDYVTASVGISNQFTLGKYSTVTNSSNDPLRCIILVKAS
jgi:hypothetical protein